MWPPSRPPLVAPIVKERKALRRKARDVIEILLLAAGAGTRMRGGDKLLEPVDGVALLRRQAMAALATGLGVSVALPVPAGRRGSALDGLALRRVPVPAAPEGMAASIRAGVAALPEDTAAVMILPADMPEIGTDEMRAVAAAFDPAGPGPVRATGADGTPGHPVLFPRADFPALERLRGDGGARPVLSAAGARVRLVALPGERALVDLDSPEAWAAWRARRGET